jgi:uncharacterized protein YqfA (UPF0365 family)
MGTPKGARESSQKDRKDYADFLIQWNTPSIFLIDVARGTLYEAQAETEKAKAERERAQARLIETQRKALTHEQNEEKGEDKQDAAKRMPRVSIRGGEIGAFGREG